MVQLLSPGTETRESVCCDEGWCMSQQRSCVPQLDPCNQRNKIFLFFGKDCRLFLKKWIQSRKFSVDFAQIQDRNNYLWSYSLKMYFLNPVTWTSKPLLDPWAADRMLCWQPWRQHGSHCTSSSDSWMLCLSSRLHCFIYKAQADRFNSILKGALEFSKW